MSRLVLLLLLPALTAASLAVANPPPPRHRSPTERLKEIRRDLALVRKLVRGGLQLANETDPLKRADHCNALAKGLSREVERAVKDRDRSRADVLGQKLEALLVRGVAGNMQRAREKLPPNAPTPPELHRLRDEALSVMDPLRKEFDRVPDHEQEQMSGVLHAVTQGQAEVEKAAGGRKGRKGRKAPPVGNKLRK
jgi:hypothetical protein